MGNKESSNQSKKVSKIKIKKENNNSLKEFKTENKKQISLSQNQIKKDKNEIIPLPSEYKGENKKVENNIIQNNCVPKNNNINIPLNQSSSKKDNNNSFPKGTISIYEEELSQYFQYLNVFWYDPDNTNDYKLFKKCFEKIDL